MIPQDAGYYHAAYIIAVVVYGLYAVGLQLRLRRARGRLAAGSRADADRRPA